MQAQPSLSGVPFEWIAQVRDGAELLRLARRLVDLRKWCHKELQSQFKKSRRMLRTSVSMNPAPDAVCKTDADCTNGEHCHQREENQPDIFCCHVGPSSESALVV